MLRNNMAKKILFGMIIMLLALGAYSVSFTANPGMSPITPHTDDNLVCSFTPSEDTIQKNVSWYKDGSLFFNETVIVNSSTINSADTLKNQDWTCNVTLYNGTDTVSSSTTITILNSAPEEPIIKNSSDDIISSPYDLMEDVTYALDINSTDADDDTLTYRVSPTDSFCSITDSATGAVSCTPDTTYLTTVNTTGYENITFWADDPDSENPISTGTTIQFRINPVNDAPYFVTNIQNQSINEGEIFNYYLQAADEENNTPINFTLESEPALNLTINITGNETATIMFSGNRTATYREGGNYTINLTLEDSKGASYSTDFLFEIVQVNVPPVFRNITTPITGTQGGALSFNVYADDSDINDTLNFNSITSPTCSLSNPWSITTTNSSSNATGLVDVVALNNTHIACRNIIITVIDDAGAEDSLNVFLNLTNTNDPPKIETLSSNPSNTGGSNITNLTAYAQSPFIYYVNGSDVDSFTYEDEVLTYTDNSSLFNITSSTGLISFTPTNAQVGTYNVNITLSDDGGLSTSKLLSIEVITNNAPSLSLSNYSCNEDSLCYINLSASDLEGDNITFESNNTAVFNITKNSSTLNTAYVNYTPMQSDVGNYSINITATDKRGAKTNQIISFNVNNTNDAPVFNYFLFPDPIVETHTVAFTFYATDEDYQMEDSYENLTFSDVNITGKDLFDVVTLTNASGVNYAGITFTPAQGEAGFYEVNITVTDYYGINATVTKNFTIRPKSNPPNITSISPFGSPYSSVTNFSFTNTSNYNNSITYISFSENRSVTYNATVTDDDTSVNNLIYRWYVNGVSSSTNSYLTQNYDFFSSGSKNITLVVNDTDYESSSWTWMVTVNDLNRAPKLITNLRNLTVNGTENFGGYLLQEGSNVRFIDPDDDLNSNDEIDGSESSSLSYTVSSCSYATITIIDDSIKITPSSIGSCNVYFNATDGQESIVSNVVNINITGVPPATSSTQSDSTDTGGGGGGGGGSSSIIVPINRKDDTPKTLEIVVPSAVTIYEGGNVSVPLQLKNNWETAIEEISLSASFNSSGNLSYYFQQDFIESLPVDSTLNTNLIIQNYRFGENLELTVTAAAKNPETNDSALVLINSLESSSDGRDVETKVTFAQDLLNENPECLELNELLAKAQELIEEGNRVEAAKIVDGVIEGCKYLVSLAKKEQQKPSNIVNKILFEKENRKYLWFFIGGIILVSGIVVGYRKFRTNKKIKEIKDEKSEKKEDEFKPYW
jgi:hypothetical protein